MSAPTEQLATTPPAAPAPPPHPARFPLMLLGSVLALALIAYGALTMVILMSRHSASSSAEYGSGITSIRVESWGMCGGGITVVGEQARETVSASWKDSWSLARPTREVRREGPALVVDVDCSWTTAWTPSVDLTLRVPRETALSLQNDSGSVLVSSVVGDLTVRSDSGRVEAVGIRGNVDVQTDSGSITASEVQGDLTLRSDSGSIRAYGGRSSRVALSSDSGSQRLVLTRPPTEVTASSDSGSVSLLLPASSAYAVTTQTDSGSERVRVQRDPDAASRVEVRTDSGSILVGNG
ncbi:DUF4097 family beta strand repeat-containing protein [Motilibacter aurantiacus]|uniref:DUF4097 family beta strand repeat-containing protein n=1 Tax=Motilibacter aurantiacus TaxID=2714955 RepID=UPI001409CC78|nr:DUF4097 family beta strand repeat-containing protein [Motilibacter aurantiacus]NHC45662.1 DUF4097 domain-containing protein [Motilibacter aurantiacus]